MADQEDVTDIMEQENVVVEDDGASNGLPTTMVVTNDDAMMVANPGESTETPMDETQQRVDEEEEVGGILEQAMASHNLIEYAEESPVDNNNTTTDSVVSVVGPTGDIVNTVVDTAVLSHNNNNTESTQGDESEDMTTDPVISVGDSTTMDHTTVVVSRNNNENVVDNVVSNVLSIPQVVHIQQTTQVQQQQQELPVMSTQEQQQQQHGIGHATVVMVAAADQGGERSQHVEDLEPSPSPPTQQPQPQPVTIENHRYVDGAGNFTVVAPANSSLSQQQNSLSQAIANSTIGSGVVADDNSGVVHHHQSALSHQALVNQHTGLTTVHVLAAAPGVSATGNGNDSTNMNNNDDDSNTNEIVVHHQMQTTYHHSQQHDEDDGLEQEMDPDEIAAQQGVENGRMDTSEEGIDSEMENGQSPNDLPPGSISITLAPSNDESGAPLGSSQNPIRIIQQGNQYTPLQQLTTDQLQQIMQVVQQQQLARNTQAEGSSILYNPQTNTRIVYRVIYPSELHKSAGNGASAEDGSDGGGTQIQVETQSQGQQTVTFGQLPRRPYRRRNKEEEEKIDGPELTKEEKEERKKHRPRTRSGRVSKPPKHMVKDYKHIHVLDWDEDYDDSDGGYSDFKYSEDEEAERRAAAAARGNLEGLIDEPYIHPGLGSSKPKNFKCETCAKAYIGRAGLARHYRLNPDHGQLSAEDELELRNQVLHQAATNGLNNSGNISEDSNTQDSILGLSSVSVPKSTPISTSAPITVTLTNSVNTTNPVPTTPGPAPSSVTISTNNTTTNTTSNNINHVVRGRKISHLHETPAKRKARLKELIKQCEDEELMEIVLPRLATVITVWEFLLMKVEKGRPSRPHMADVYKEFETLHKQVQKMCQKYLSLLPEGENHLEGNPSNRLQIQNPTVAQALGLNTGTYEVKEIPVHEDNNTFQYKLLTTEASTLSGTSCQTAKRTVELVTQEQLISQPLSKRIRLVSLNTNELTDLSQFPANSIVTLPGPTNQQQQQQQPHTRTVVDCTNNQSQLAPLPPPPPQPQRTPLSETHNIRPIVEASNSGCVTNISTKNNSTKVVLGGSSSNAVASATPRTTVHFINGPTAQNRAIVQISGSVGGNESVSPVAAATTTTTVTSKTTTAPLVNGVSNATSGTTVMLPIRVVSTAPPSTQQSSAELVPPIPPPPPPPPPTQPLTVLPHMAATTLTLPKVTSDDETLAVAVQDSESPEPSLPPSATDSVDMVDAADPLHLQTPPTVSLPVSVTQSPPSPTQTSVVAAVPMSAEPSSPLTELTQIQHSGPSSPQIHMQSEMDEVADEAPATTSTSGGVEHTVMEVPLAMEPSQPITVAVSNDSVLDLESLNSEDNDLKGRELSSIDQSQIIFQDSVAGQIVSPESLVTHSNIFQTADGIIIIQKPDGSTLQFQGEQRISLETVQALLAMDTEGQLEQVTPVQQQQQTTDMEEQ